MFMQGGVDHEGNVSARMNQGWTPSSVSKLQAQVSPIFVFGGSALTPDYQVSQTPGHSLLQLEHDYQGLDYSLNAKAVNPWPTDLTGIYVGSYLQSLTKNFALGVEYLYQRATPETSELAASYLAKFTSTDKNTIATAQLHSGMMQATYWQKLSDKVDVAADLQVIATPQRRDAIATLGAKYDLHVSSFRAQVDSTGKVSALLEQRFTPTFAFLMSGEIDHFKVRLILAPSYEFIELIIPTLELGESRSGCNNRELDSDPRGGWHVYAATTTPSIIIAHLVLYNG